MTVYGPRFDILDDGRTTVAGLRSYGGDRPIPDQTASVRLCSFADALFLGYLRNVFGYNLPTSGKLNKSIRNSLLRAGILAFGL